MQILRGKGKIYDSRENYVDKVTYEIYHKSSAERDGAEWWGEVTPDKGIMLVGNYIIELDDGRRGPCITKIRTNSSFGLVVDSYNLEGTGSLTYKEESSHDIGN
jgi:hypothetical protein